MKIISLFKVSENRFEAKVSHALKKDWKINVKGNYRYSNYPSKGGFSREDDRYRFSIGSEYSFNNTWSMSAKYEYTDNHSTNSIDGYTRNVYQLSLNGKF